MDEYVRACSAPGSPALAGLAPTMGPPRRSARHDGGDDEALADPPEDPLLPTPSDPGEAIQVLT